jgi:NAD(P)H-hydrate epimerase
MTTRQGRPPDVPVAPLPADDPVLFELSLEEITTRWAEAAARSAIGAEAMTGADRRAQMAGVPGLRLMEHAGAAVAAVARVLAEEAGTWGRGPVLVLCGPGNNGGDGFVAARWLAGRGVQIAVVLCANEPRPGTADATRNWERLAPVAGVSRMHAPTVRDLVMVGRGVERASVVIDALLGTGVHGALRDPVRSAVLLVNRARSEAVPVVAVDTPTAVDLTSGEPSDPVVAADATVTFHRPKVGLLTTIGAALAGRVLVAPIGIPPEADRG